MKGSFNKANAYLYVVCLLFYAIGGFLFVSVLGFIVGYVVFTLLDINGATVRCIFNHSAYVLP